MTEFDQLVKIINAGGVVAVLLLGVIAFLRGWIVRGADHDKLNDRIAALEERLSNAAGQIAQLRERDESQQRLIDRQEVVIDEQRERIDHLEAELKNVAGERDALLVKLSQTKPPEKPQ